jgi:hypothetical protein
MLNIIQPSLAACLGTQMKNGKWKMENRSFTDRGTHGAVSPSLPIASTGQHVSASSHALFSSSFSGCLKTKE